MLQVPGLRYLEDFIDEAAQQALLDQLDNAPWRDDLQRRVQHYGYRYDYKARQVDRSMFLGALPDWLQVLAERLYREKLFDKLPDQAIINEYQAGQGISAHVDCVPCFGPQVASLSLLSSCVMEFISKADGEVVPISLAPRSLVLLTEEARYRWQHRIPGRKSDKVDGVATPRSRRISVTFRTVRLATE